MDDFEEQDKESFEQWESAEERLLKRFRQEAERLNVLDILPSKHALQQLMQIAKVREQEQQHGNCDEFIGQRTGELYRPKNRVLYFLQQEESALRLSLASEPHQSKRSLATLRPLGRELLLSPKPPCYATVGDIEIARLWQRITGGAWNYEDLSIAVPQSANALIKRVLATNRCYLFDQMEGPRLRFGEELRGSLFWQQNKKGNFGLGFVVVSAEGKTLQSLSMLPPWYVDLETGLCGPINTNLSEEILKHVAVLQDLSQADLAGLPYILSELKIAEVVPALENDNTVTVELVSPVPTLELELAHPPKESDIGPTSEAEFQVRKRTLVPVAKICCPEVIPTAVRTPDGALRIIKPDPSARGRFENELLDLGLFKTRGFAIGKGNADAYFAFINKDDWLSFSSRALPELKQRGWEASSSVEAILTPLNLAGDAVHIEAEAIDENGWWFNLALNINIEGTDVPLRPVLEAGLGRLPEGDIDYSVDTLNADGNFPFFLEDGRIVQVPFERVRNILVTLGDAIRKGFGKKQLKVCASDLLELKDIWSSDETIEKLKRLAEPADILPSTRIKAELRQYQADGVQWMQRLARERLGGLLADDMGLGKTVQLIAHICIEKDAGYLQEAPFLVVCPKSIIHNWVRECSRFAPHLRVLPFIGSNRWNSAKPFEQYDLVLTSYHTLAKDRGKLKEYKWHGIAMDESQCIKNAESLSAEAARQLQSNHRFGVTGTPVENNLGELWSQFQFALPGFLGGRDDFKKLRNAIEEGDLASKKLLAKRVRPFVLRRTKDEVLKDLPPKTTVVRFVELEGDQQDLYETVRLTFTKKIQHAIETYGIEKSQIVIIEAMLRLRQVCCDPRLVKWSVAQETQTSAKLVVLLDMVDELVQQDRRILIFSQFTSMLNIIASRLSALLVPFEVLSGKTKHRQALIHRFQTGDFPVFLISLKAGGVGLNLTTADVVIHYDPWWNPAVEDQASDRAHRIGQTRPVSVYKLIGHGTIEERMLQLQEKKRMLVHGLFDENAAHSFSFTKEDIDLLLSPIVPY